MDNSSTPDNKAIDSATFQYWEQLSTTLDEKITNLKVEISNILAAKDAAYEESLVKRTSREIATLSVHLLQKDSELAALKAKESEYLNQISALEAECTHLRNTVNHVFSSTSWKLTAPLRKIVRLLKR